MHMCMYISMFVHVNVQCTYVFTCACMTTHPVCNAYTWLRTLQHRYSRRVKHFKIDGALLKTSSK